MSNKPSIVVSGGLTDRHYRRIVEGLSKCRPIFVGCSDSNVEAIAKNVARVAKASGKDIDIYENLIAVQLVSGVSSRALSNAINMLNVSEVYLENLNYIVEDEILEEFLNEVYDNTGLNIYCTVVKYKDPNVIRKLNDYLGYCGRKYNICNNDNEGIKYRREGNVLYVKFNRNNKR